MADGKDPQHQDARAAAILYTPDLPAPIVLAKGKKHRAESIIRIARENNVQIVSDMNIIDNLDELEIGQYIPPNLFGVVARLLRFVYTIDNHG